MLLFLPLWFDRTLSSSELRDLGAVVHLRAEPDLPPASGDVVQVQQVFTNLLLNAAQAMTDRCGPKAITLLREPRRRHPRRCRRYGAGHRSVATGADFRSVHELGPKETLFVNNEDGNEIETASLATGAVGSPIALPGCEAPSGLAYDARSHLLISACANGKAAVVDAATKRQVALLDIGLGPDAVILDAERRLAFVPCGKSGTLSILSLAGTRPKVVGTIATAVGAKTGALDPRTGTLYLPTADFGPPAKPGGRPVAKPGTFHILVVRPVGA